LLVACSKPHPVPPAAPIAKAPEPPPPPCIAVADDTPRITHARAGDTNVAYCLGKDCFAMDLDSGKLARLDAPPPDDSPSVHVETTNPEVKVCTGTSCKTLTSKIMPGTDPLHVATNGAVAVVLLGDADAGKGYAEVWDVSSGKRTAAFKYAQGDFKCGDVALLGDTIYVSASTCSGPAARGSLWSLAGKKIAAVGGKDFGVYGDAHVQLDGSTWAFLEESGNRIALQDIAKGKVKKTIDIGLLFGTVGAMGNPGESAIVKVGNKLAVIAGAPANGSVAVVDPANGEVKVWKAPVCGAPSS
jgi:hypothetical protein